MFTECLRHKQTWMSAGNFAIHQSLNQTKVQQSIRWHIRLATIAVPLNCWWNSCKSQLCKETIELKGQGECSIKINRDILSSINLQFVCFPSPGGTLSSACSSAEQWKSFVCIICNFLEWGSSVRLWLKLSTEVFCRWKISSPGKEGFGGGVTQQHYRKSLSGPKNRSNAVETKK